MSKKQRTVISLAGPAANLVVAVLLLAAGAAGLTSLTWFEWDGPGGGGVVQSGHFVFWAAVEFLGFLQVFAVVINLLPIPGLDGYGAIEPWLSYETQRKLHPVRQWGFLVLLVILVFPNPIGMAIRGLILGVFDLLGGDHVFAGLGRQLALPWQ